MGGVTGEESETGYSEYGDGGERPGPTLPVLGELDEDEDYIDELTGYGDEVTVSGPTPVSVTEPAGLYGAPVNRRGRSGRRLRKGERTRLRKRKPEGKK